MDDRSLAEDPGDVDRFVDDEIRAANYGSHPSNKDEFNRAAERFGCTVAYYDPARGLKPACVKDGLIFVPDIRKGYPVQPVHLHELAEACLRSGVMNAYSGSQSCTRHAIAERVDLLAPRPGLTQDRRLKIDAYVRKIAPVLQDAGYESMRICVGSDGPSWRVEG